MDKTAPRALVSFIRSYTDLLEKQLEEIRSTMRETVDGVMFGIQDISQRTTEKKKEATTVLVTTYTNPSEDAKKSMDEVQDEVSRIVEEAQVPKTAVAPTSAGGDEELRSKLRRNAGFFSKHMEALSTLDDDLQSALMTMMGLLSRDDVISQRIEHVVQGLQAMQTSLSYILVDFESRCRQADVDKLANDLKQFTLRTYTMEEEKKLFATIFGDVKKAS